MRPRNRFIIGLLGIALVVLLMIVFAPALLSRGVQLWLWWKTRGSDVTVKIEEVDAPFLSPIVLRGVRIHTTSASAVQINVSAARVVFALNLKGILLRTRGRTLRKLVIQDLHAEVRRKNSGAAFTETGWNTVQRLLPDSFEIQSFDVRVEDTPTVVLLRGISLSGSPIEAGRIQAGEVVVSSPMIRQTFTNLRGATDWQGDRLTIAGLTLTGGLDVQSITADLSHLGKRRVAVEFDVDAFGGKLRGSIADEWRSRRSNWNIAGSATDISVAQTAEAFGFTDHVGGLIHGGKFTFRGDLGEALTGTASLWMELTAPAWRDREADVIMLGLSLYGRQIELQQLYIRQKKNQLTLNGEGSFPTTAAGWLHPDFRGTVSASIDDLGEFASLFGGNRNDFAGRIAVEGTLNARDRNVGGNLVANGSGLTMFKSSIDEFQTDLKLKRDETEITQLELRRKNDSLWAQGKIDNSPEHNYSGTIDTTIENIGDYLSIVYGPIDTAPTSATVHADITSSVWELRSVFDPPRSKPVNLSATFPLRIGQSADAFWTSPITLTVKAPELYLTELPRKNLITSHFQHGTLSASIAVKDSPRHPRIAGYAQISGGRIDSTDLDGRVRFEDNRGVIESAEIGGHPNGASFYGEIDFQDTQHLAINLFPNQTLYDLTGPMLDCVDEISVVPTTPPVSTSGIGAVQFRGSVTGADWQVNLEEFPLDGIPVVDRWNSITKTLRFCPDGKASLRIGVQTFEPVTVPLKPAAKPPRPRKKKR